MNTTLNTTGCYRGGGYIQTSTGRMFCVTEPTPDQIHLEDIANAAAKLCRFGGHVSHFYSVGQHAALCGIEAHRLELDPNTVRACFLHDASESFVADLVRPIKLLPGFQQYREIESRIQAAVWERFCVDYCPVTAAAVKRIDNQLLRCEARCLMPDQGNGWDWSDTEDIGLTIKPIENWRDVKTFYLLSMLELGGIRP